MRPGPGLLLLMVLAPLAGCTAADPASDGSGSAPDGPAPGRTELEPRDVRMRWQDQEEVHLLVGRAAWTQDGVTHIDAHEEGIEGGDFGLVLEWRATGPGRLAYDDALSDPRTFRFAYEEAVFWNAEPVCRLLEVEGRSSVEVVPGAGVGNGAFDLWFTGDCEGRGPYARHVHGTW